MTKQEEVIRMDDKLHPIGTLMYEDTLGDSTSADSSPHRTIWRVKSHELCASHPLAPTRLACSIELVRTEPLIEE